jgi:hypothetical protein
VERSFWRQYAWLLIVVLLPALAQMLCGLLVAVQGSGVNDDFQIEARLNGVNILTPDKLVMDPRQAVSLDIRLYDFRHNVKMNKISWTVLIMGKLSGGTGTEDLNGEYGPDHEPEYNLHLDYANPTTAITQWNLPWVTGTHRLKVRLEYTIDNQPKWWEQSKEIEIPGVLSVVSIAAGTVAATALFLVIRAMVIRAGRARRAVKYAADSPVMQPAAVKGPAVLEKRYLQERNFIEIAGRLVEEQRVFFQGVKTHIRIRIGLADDNWLSPGSVFPDYKLPPNKDNWTLDVVLTEPNHMITGLSEKIVYPASGSSPECEFILVPQNKPLFEGRVTVLHRGRVLQTGVLKGRVVAAESQTAADDKITFSDIRRVRFDTATLDIRRQFDLALVENHSTNGLQSAQAVSDDSTWLIDLSHCDGLVKEINETLSQAAHTTADFNGNLDSDYGNEVMRSLARSGFNLNKEVVTNFTGNRAKLFDSKYLQLISTRIDSLVPFEFIYDFSYPAESSKICTRWQSALNGPNVPFTDCSVYECRKKARAMIKCDFICPLGFWGLSKVIERQIPDTASETRTRVRLEPAADHETISLGGTVLIGAHKKADGDNSEKALVLDRLIEACNTQFGVPGQEAKTWDEWPGLVKSLKPTVMILLSHTEGSGSTVSLEIGGQALKCGEINWHYLKPQDDESLKPLVALLGCDTTGSSMRYGGAVSHFHNEGAAIVIGTIAEVFGQHSVRVAEMLIKRLNQGSPDGRRIGEVMQSIKREALKEGLLLGLCLVAFGDADWIID